MRTTVIVGNPKAQSRTLEAAKLVAMRICGQQASAVFDLVTLGPGLVDFDDPEVASAVEVVRTSHLVVVASPTFKAAYTGILKTFLDKFPSDGLAGVVAVPLMLGASMGHSLAPELALKPVLVEMGATCPTRALYLLDSDWQESPLLEKWLVAAVPQLVAALDAGAD